ncbi:unnamed protein product [Caretta caretta]
MLRTLLLALLGSRLRPGARPPYPILVPPPGDVALLLVTAGGLVDRDKDIYRLIRTVNICGPAKGPCPRPCKDKSGGKGDKTDHTQCKVWLL